MNIATLSLWRAGDAIEIRHGNRDVVSDRPVQILHLLKIFEVNRSRPFPHLKRITRSLPAQASLQGYFQKGEIPL